MAISKLILNGEVQMDVTSDTVEANKLLSGETATKNDGTKVTGTYIPTTFSTQSKSVSPTESVQNVTPDTGYDGLSKVTVYGISSEYIGSAIPLKSSTDLTANGSTVTAPAGYYSTAATKNISGGSAIPPAVTITKAPTFTMNSATGVVTASYSGSSAVTPTVTAGYISQGTAGTISTSGTSTYQLTSKAAATIYPSTADQTIASYRWLTGTQTIKSVTTSNLTAANIKSGVVVRVGDATNSSRITQITGTYSAPTPTISALTVTPTTTTQTFNATTVSGYKPVTVNAIPSSYIIPTGTSSITSNGIYDIGSYASVDVSVAGGGGDENAFIERSFSSTTYSNSTLTKIGMGAFAGVSTLSAINVPNVTEIGPLAFFKCLNLNAYSYSNRFNFKSVISIGEGAFAFAFYKYAGTYGGGLDFENLTTIGSYAFVGTGLYGSFPNVTTVGEGAFIDSYEKPPSMPLLEGIPDYCFLNNYSGLFSVSYPKARYIGRYAFASMKDYNLCINQFSQYSSFFYLASDQVSNGNGLKDVNCPLVTSIDVGAFMFCERLSSATFPECITIGSRAFESCHELSIISFPKCTTIHYSAFQNTPVQSAIFPECITIGSAAFQSCGLSIADFPSCTRIHHSAFASCTKLSDINFPECTQIDGSAFGYCYSLNTANFPKCISIGGNAFTRCSNLTTLSFPVCETILGGAFMSCSNIVSANFPQCTSIGNSAFASCIRMTAVSFPECTFIGTGAFRSCSSLAVVHIPKCTSLGSYVFEYCQNVTSIYLTEVSAVPSAGYLPLCRTATIYVPSSLYNDFLIATNLSTYSSQYVSV